MNSKRRRSGKTPNYPKRTIVPATTTGIPQIIAAIYDKKKQVEKAQNREEIIAQKRKELFERYRSQQANKLVRNTSTNQESDESENSEDGGIWTFFDKNTSQTKEENERKTTKGRNNTRYR